MKCRGTIAVLALFLTLVMVAGAFALEKAELINGNQWHQWTERDKLIYVRGLGNWADFVNEAPPLKGKSREFALSRIFVDTLRNRSLGQVVGDVDAYYRDNPGKLDISVIEAIMRSTRAYPK